MEIDSLLALYLMTGRACRPPPSGMPTLAGDVLPADLELFYDTCGGLRFTETGMTIVAPDRFIPASEAIVGAPTPDDPSSRWYIVAESGTESTAERIVIDLSACSQGRCYDAFWDRYGVAGSMPVVAGSFADFLDRLLISGGQPYWNAESFVSLGDAYDSP